MCGRFALGLSHEEIEEMHGYNVQIGEWVGQDQFVPRYNVAPRSNAPVIRRRDDGEGGSASGSGSSSGSSQPGPSSRRFGTSTEKTAENGLADTSTTSSKAGVQDVDGRLMLHTMRWGLVPHFSKHEDGSLKTINARSEALIEEGRGLWTSIKGRKRCAVPCQGYYEWLKKGKERLPHFTKHKDGRLMLLAGLWDCVVLEGSTEQLWTFTIVTREASKEMSWLHDRQPVILDDEDALRTWLDTCSDNWTGQLSKLCAPRSQPLECYQVPKEVGKIGTESAKFIQPIADRKDGIQAMFAKQVEARSAPPKRSPSRDVDDVPSEHKKAKMNTWEDDSDIEYVSGPVPQKNADAPLKSKASPRKPKPPPRSDSSAKITSFFSRK
ncbi:hypothetical protein C8Q74DRAFT_1301877 [Fomes fomentarius]|nr:hypothetical protein C8Q74DRAFT_1301877 [Fomes fomentarius]